MCSLPPSFFCGSSPSWELMSSQMDDTREHFAVISDCSQKKFIVVGGYLRPCRLTCCESFDIKTEKWEKLPSMLTPRHNFSLVCGRNNVLYAMGGSNDEEAYLQSVECIQFVDDGSSSSRNGWEHLPSMINRRSDFSATLVQNKIIVVGGTDQYDNPTEAVEELDLTTQTLWTPLPDMPEPRTCHAMETVDDTVYVFGGYGESGMLDTAACYNIITKQWESLPNMPSARVNGAAVTVGHCILLIGGERNGTENTILDRVDCFHTVTRQWVMDGALPSLHTARMNCGVVLVGNQKVFVVGGSANHEGRVIKTMEKMEVNPYYAMAPQLMALLQEDEVLPMGLWPHVLARWCHAASLLFFIFSSNKAKAASVLLQYQPKNETRKRKAVAAAE